jgi:FkbM family methyltransferase
MSHFHDKLQWIENVLHQTMRAGISVPFMIDVGAHHGTSIEPFLNAGWSGIAFEPMEHNRRRMAERLGQNPRLTIRPEAVSDRTTTRLLQLALDGNGVLHEFHHSLEDFKTDPWHTKGPKIEVATVSLDDLVARGEVPSAVGFLKIDTEGHDLCVLRGASQIESEVVSVEFWNPGHTFGPSPSPAKAMVKLLRERGFEQFIAVTHFLDQTEVFYSTLDGVRPDAWGNLILFHGSRTGLYERVLADSNWQMVLEQSRRIDRLNTELRQKQAVIEELKGAAEERLQLIIQLTKALSEYSLVRAESDRTHQPPAA